MKKLFLFLPVLLVISMTGFSQYTRYVVALKNKTGTTYSINNPAAFLSQRAIARRQRLKIAIDSIDLPISKSYLDSIRSVPNVTVLNVSKWLNQVCIKTSDPAAIAKIQQFSFVQQTAAVAVRMAGNQPVMPWKQKEFNQVPGPVPATANRAQGLLGTYDYGSNINQVHIHEGEYLHNLGFHGEGMVITMLDAGYYHYLTNPAFDSLRLQNQILGTWDFVDNELSVNEDHSHGALCLSTMAANTPGKIIGTAPKAKYWLLRTEDAYTEYPVEEQNWAAAAEFADSVGTDVISSSLGYTDFDDHAFDHTYAQRDGKTSFASKAANIAVQKGIFVTVSAGNSGNVSGDGKYVACPADAENALSVGAVDANGIIAGFSSWGPNGAGKQKPNVVSVGAPGIVADANTGEPTTAAGTSLANPNLCGLVTCLWQAFPDFSNTEIFAVLQKNSSQSQAPDVRYGYGIPNMRLAYLDLLAQREARKSQQDYQSQLNILGGQWIKAYPVPFNSTLNVLIKAPVTGQATLRLVDMLGKTIEYRTVALIKDNMTTVQFGSIRSVSRAVFTIQYNDGSNKASLRIIRQ